MSDARISIKRATDKSPSKPTIANTNKQPINVRKSVLRFFEGSCECGGIADCNKETQCTLVEQDE